MSIEPSRNGGFLARSSRRALVAGACIGLLAVTATAQATHQANETDGHTSLEQILAPTDPAAVKDGNYSTLAVQAVDDNYLLRDPAGVAKDGRETRRKSLTYISQFTDFQVADEESPARVEFLDPQAASAWRPQEAFHPFVVDAMIRQVNRFVAASPVPQGDGSAAAMDFGLVTGDQADNQQRNETIWVRELLEGGKSISFGSGSEDPATYTDPEVLARTGCADFVAQLGIAAMSPSPDAAVAAAVEEAKGYTGVQDYSDYPGDPANPAGQGNTAFYDPDAVAGTPWEGLGWPTYDGLMDHAQEHEFTPEGLKVPFYITNGNHDALLQGNEDSNRPLEDIALSCSKVLASNAAPSQAALEAIFANPTLRMLVPPDDERQTVSKPQIKEIYGATTPNDDDHGFARVDAEELEASNGSASYYAWNPEEAPGFRYISIDTVSEGGVLGPFGPQPTGSSEGNIDDPQWQWLLGELKKAVKQERRVILFGHHPIRTLTVFNPTDEQASPCTGPDPHGHGHDANPGCDLDPRRSTPLHLGEPDQRPPGDSAETLTELIDRFPNVLAYVAGHTHENDLRPYKRSDGGVWWEIGTSAGSDWPQQARLIEVMDNQDGSLSIFATIVDPAAPATSPAQCTTADCAKAFDTNQLASIGHTFAFNDPQISGDPRIVAEGDPEDRNAELLLPDPLAEGGDRGAEDNVCAAVNRGTDGADQLTGDAGVNGISGEGGPDRIIGGDGDDCLFGGRGKDRVSGNGGDDLVAGNEGRDKLRGGGGADALRGGSARDTMRGGKGDDKLNGHRGRDKIRGNGGADEIRGGADSDEIHGGGGDDQINVIGGGRDIVFCGTGEDTVRAGRRDKVFGSCEKVIRRS